MEDKMLHAFAAVSVVWGYHEYKNVWNALTDGTVKENQVILKIHWL